MKLFLALFMTLAWAGRVLAVDAPDPALIDQHLFDAVPVVIRARVLDGAGGSKYLFVKIEVLSVLKAPESVKLPSRMGIYYYSTGQLLPPGVSTLYLVPYNPDKPEYGWKLFEEWDKQAKVLKKGYSHHVES